MKAIRCSLLLVFMTSFGASFANAQAGLDVFFGLGTAQASSSNQLIDTFGDGNLYSTPRLGGVFGKAGADVMLTPHFGVNGELDFRFAQTNYAGLQYRPVFYDFNGVWLPFGDRFKRIVPEVEAGFGGVNLRFYYPSSYCDAFAGCSNANQYLESSNHFQFHFAAGLRVYVTSHIFVRPQVDAHWVNNFYQFGTNWVPEYGAVVGWSFGSH
ncbi:MAG: hypothetical protein M3Y72_16705 [Acidobacteriota bacterium]|nr:hypothetical protein [Acidobacteriota bacterium]